MKSSKVLRLIQNSQSVTLLHLPNEVLIDILLCATTPSFLHFIIICRRIFNLAGGNRKLILHHLQSIPGIKIGLEDNETEDLFLILRQRASKHLFGLNFTANCHEYLLRNALLRHGASSLDGQEADYIRMSLAFEDSMTVRQYTSNCSLKERIESPYADGNGKILQVVQRTNVISVLSSWDPPIESPPLDEDEENSSTDECLPIINNNPNVAIRRLDSFNTNKYKFAALRRRTERKTRYHLLHYDVYANDRPYFFTIEPHKKLVPKHLAVESRSYCAILWDDPTSTSPTDSAEVLIYSAKKLRYYEDATYDSKVIWPKLKKTRSRSRSLSSDDSDEEIVKEKPKRIAFFKDTRRIKMYSPGSIIPYTTFSTFSNQHELYAPTNHIEFEDFIFNIDTPFFGMHETYNDLASQRVYCNITHLCLGVAEIHTGVKVLCILRSRSRSDYEYCTHNVSLERMAHISADNCRAVARLWGWQEQPTNLTALETVSTSRGGTRIAISSWNKVLVYALDPRMLCEELIDESDDDQPRRRKKKQKQKAKGVADDFYTRTSDPVMKWNLAELKPVVLDLGGAVAQKMSWSIKSGSAETDNDESTDPEKDEEVMMKWTGSINGNDAGFIEEPTNSVDIGTSLVPTEETNHQSTKQSTNSSVDGVLQNSDNNSFIQPLVSPTGANSIPTLKLSQRKKEKSVDKSDVETTNKPTDMCEKNNSESELGLSNLQTNSPMETSGNQSVSTNMFGPPNPSVASLVINDSPPQPQPVLPNELMTDDQKFIPFSNGAPINVAPFMDPLPTQKSVAESLSHLPTKRSKPSSSSSRRRKVKKRTTEDELIILTDRGVQVWNLGARAKGIRRARSLNGVIPKIHRSNDSDVEPASIFPPVTNQTVRSCHNPSSASNLTSTMRGGKTTCMSVDESTGSGFSSS